MVKRAYLRGSGEGGKSLDILVTNDDGVDARGLAVLAERLRRLGNVTVVAPAEEMSAISHALSLKLHLSFESVAERTFAVQGTPADCVNFAIRKLLPRTPDLVVSGINRGANVADDVAYSGTVAGAREAAMLGVRAIAVSLASKADDADYSHAAAFVEKMITRIAAKKDWGRRTFLNVNVPAEEIKGVRITNHGRREPWAKLESGTGSKGRAFQWIKQGLNLHPKNGMSDIEALKARFIAVTPLHFDFTNYDVLEELGSWNLSFNGQK